MWYFSKCNKKLNNKKKRVKINKSEHQSNKNSNTKRDNMFGAIKINEYKKTHLRRNTIPFKIFCVTIMCVCVRS